MAHGIPQVSREWGKTEKGEIEGWGEIAARWVLGSALEFP